MKHPSTAFSQPYHLALRTHLARQARPNREAVGKIGSKAKSTAIPVLDIAKIHEQFLVMDLLPDCAAGKQAALIRRSGEFFAAVVAASSEEHTSARDVARANKTIGSLCGHSVELALANRQLDLENARCGDHETALLKSERGLTTSLEECEVLKERLRGLSRQILTAQEEERKKISSQLHDVITQALAGINLRLAALKAETGSNSTNLVRNISLTQEMVTKSAAIVHQFALELRPAVLDDLGLIPALRSFMTDFTERTGVRTHLTVFKGVEEISALKRTVLYRVAEEALTNVGSHAQASSVEVSIRRKSKFVRLEVADDGKSFQARQIPSARGAKRLGLLGMRERVGMVGGSFEIESAPGEGTKIIARIPIGKTTEGRWREEPDPDIETPEIS